LASDDAAPMHERSQQAEPASPGDVNSLFGDGSVRFIKNSISPLTWIGLNSIQAGEVLTDRCAEK
jgi:hypothetical protein